MTGLRLGKTIVKGGEFYPGLEVRIGSAGSEGKQIQSVVPPSLMANGTRPADGMASGISSRPPNRSWPI